MNKFFSTLTIATLILILSACNGFFDKDNTPTPAALTQYTPEIKPQLLWSAKTGSGSGNENLKLTPAISGSAIYLTNNNGVVTSVNRLDGHIDWQTNTNLPITTGPGVGDGVVAIGSQRGKLAVLNQANGQLRFEKTIRGEFLANPAVAHGVIVVKTMDGIVRGLSLRDGEELWSYQLSEPAMVLRGASNPIVSGNDAIIGFANGKLAKLSVTGGQQRWLQTIATANGAYAIQRMIDISDPLIFKQHIYAATYQGKIAALDLHTGAKRWAHDLSSYAGMSADENAVYISDANSDLWSFNAATGGINWQQNQLHDRGVTGPASIGNYIVVGDTQGYLHWINAKNGRLAAREHIGSSITASPLARNGVIYALTNNGNLVAYTIGTGSRASVRDYG